jgi:hypothetical protein
MKFFSKTEPFLLIAVLLIITNYSLADQWEHIGLAGMEVISIEADYSNADCICAGTRINGLYVTADGGEIWQNKISSNVPISFIGTDPLSWSVLYALVSDSYSAGIYSSPDNGNQWDLVNYFIYPRQMAFDYYNAGHVYICHQNGIITSENYGLNYQDANNGLPDLNIIDVMGHGSIASEAYAVGETFVARTTDFGQNWEDLGGLFGLENYNPAKIAHVPYRPDTLYVACWAYVARSFDGGDSWEYTETPTVANQAIICDPEIFNIVFVGSNGGGVLVSTDTGASFDYLNENLGNHHVHCLAFDTNGRLLAGTNNGIYMYEFPVSIKKAENSLPRSASLYPNYPNPFNAATTIKYDLPISSEIRLDICDILGRKVQTIYNGKQPAGSHSVIWNADRFSSGIYFYKLTAGEYEQAEKMMLIK